MTPACRAGQHYYRHVAGTDTWRCVDCCDVVVVEHQEPTPPREVVHA